MSILFILIQMLSQVGEDMEFLKYLTPMTLFDPKAIAAGNGELWMTAVLYLGGVLLYGLGITIFSKKDLSL